MNTRTEDGFKEAAGAWGRQTSPVLDPVPSVPGKLGSLHPAARRGAPEREIRFPVQQDVQETLGKEVDDLG